jgi:hypothetical protein
MNHFFFCERTDRTFGLDGRQIFHARRSRAVRVEQLLRSGEMMRRDDVTPD